MTFDEIVKKGKEGVLTRFSAYDFLQERSEEISSLILNDLRSDNKATEGGKKLLAESDSCSELSSYLVNPGYIYSTEHDIAYNYFMLEKAEFEGNRDNASIQKSVLRKLINKRQQELVDLLEKIEDK